MARSRKPRTRRPWHATSMLDGVVVVDETLVWMSDVKTFVAFLAVKPGRQKDFNFAELGALQHAIVMCHLKTRWRKVTGLLLGTVS